MKTFNGGASGAFNKYLTRTFYAVSLLLFSGASSAALIQWTVDSGGNGHWYEFVANSSITWEEARDAASASGGYLATITSIEEQTFITNSFLSSIITADEFSIAWLGAEDKAIDGVWNWVTGETWSYTNWGPGEPNLGSAEDYLAISVNNSFPFLPAGSWVDASNGLNVQVGYIVERATAVSAPATMCLFLLGLAGMAIRRKA